MTVGVKSPPEAADETGGQWAMPPGQKDADMTRNSERMVDLRCWALVGVLIGIGLAFGLAGTGCSTVEGLGRDISGAWRGVVQTHELNGGKVPIGR